MKRLICKIPVVLVAITMALTAGISLPTTALANANGQCGNAPTTSIDQLIRNYQNEGVVSQVKQLLAQAGYNRFDQSLSSWMHDRVVVASLAQDEFNTDYGCWGGAIHNVGKRSLAKGTKLFMVLPSKYAKGDVSTTPCSGCQRIVVTAHAVAMTTCSNPRPERMHFVLYVHVHHCKAGTIGKFPNCHKPTVRVKKVCVTGTNTFTCPTGTFRFLVVQGGNRKVVVMNHNPQSLGQYRVGTTVKVKELKPFGPDQWQTVSANPQTQRVSRNGNLFVFKDREVPPTNKASPAINAQAQSCVQQGQANGVVTGVVSNPNNSADTAVVTIGSQTVTVSVPANGSTSFTLSGFAPGSYSGTATLQQVNLSSSFSVTVQQCQSQPQHFTQISCVWPEEITVGAGVYVDCSVSDDNGAQIALSVSTDANSRASGIICTTNGQPACPSGGTFEFFIQGVNQGSTTVVATATANGVPASSTATFPVDPSSSGF